MLLNAFGDFKGKSSINAALTGAGLGATIGGLFGPIGMVVGGLIGAVGGLIYENFDDLKQGNFKKIFNSLGSFFAPLMKIVGGFLSNMWDSLMSIKKEDVISALNTVGAGIASMMSLSLSMTGSILKWMWNGITSITLEDIMSLGKGIFNVLDTVGSIHNTIVLGILKWIGSGIVALGESIGSLIKSVFEGLPGFGSWLLSLVKGMLHYIVDSITNISVTDSIKSFFGIGKATAKEGTGATIDGRPTDIHEATPEEIAKAKELSALLIRKSGLAPNTPESVMPSTAVDLEARKLADQAKIAADNERLADATDPTSQAAILGDIKTILEDMKKINIAQAALQKKTVDATKDISLYPMPVF